MSSDEQKIIINQPQPNKLNRNMLDLVVSMTPASGLEPVGARTSAGTVLTKVGTFIYKIGMPILYIKVPTLMG